MLLAVAGMTVVPAKAQDQTAPVTAEASTAEGQAPAADVQAPLQAPLQTGSAPTRAKLSMAEKAAAIAGAAAAGVVAFKGLSALFKSGKSKAASSAAAPTPVN